MLSSSTTATRTLGFVCCSLLSLAGSGWALGEESSPESAATIEFEDLDGALREGTHIRAPVDTRGRFRVRFFVGGSGLTVGGRLDLLRRGGWSFFASSGFDAAADMDAAAGRSEPARALVTARTTRAGALARVVRAAESLDDVVLASVRVEGAPLESGDEVEITFASRTPRVTPPVASRAQEIHLRVDREGDGRYRRMPRPLLVDFVAGPVTRYAVVAPSVVSQGEELALRVQAADANGNVPASHRGSIRLSVEREIDGEVRDVEAAESIELPSQAVFEVGGVVRVRGRARGAGVFWVAVIDDGDRRGLSNPIEIVDGQRGQRPHGANRLWWGDLNARTAASNGNGSLEENYRFARDSAFLDFVALTDLLRLTGEEALQLDPAIREAIRRGIEPRLSVTEWWQSRLEPGDRFDTPGRFSTFHALCLAADFAAGGCRNVCFAERSPIVSGASMDHALSALAELDRVDNLAVVPCVGGPIANLAYHRPGLETVVEICSTRGRFEWFAQDALGRGQRLGFVGSSGSRDGRPGTALWHRARRAGLRRATCGFDGGLTAIWATALDRASLLRGLRRRRTYATTGHRALVRFQVDGRPPGEFVTTAKAPVVRVEAHGTAPIERIDVIRDRYRVRTFAGRGRSLAVEFSDADLEPGAHYYYARIRQRDGEVSWSSPVWVTYTGAAGTSPSSQPLPPWNDDERLEDWRQLDAQELEAETAKLAELLRGASAATTAPFTELVPIRDVRDPRGDYLLYFAKRDGRPTRIRWWHGFTEPRLQVSTGWGGYGGVVPEEPEPEKPAEREPGSGP